MQDHIYIHIYIYIYIYIYFFFVLILLVFWEPGDVASKSYAGLPHSARVVVFAPYNLFTDTPNNSLNPKS